MQSLKIKKIIGFAVALLVIPIATVVGSTVFGGKKYAFFSLLVAILSCVPFIIMFERRNHSTMKLVLVAVLTALSVVGRMLFGVLPGFKPVTAMVVITAMYFGSEAGYMVGALTAVISNFYFGQGPWTPFQMLTWGTIGLIAGCLAGYLKSSKIILCIYGAIAGAAFSLIMDVWTVLWWDGTFNISRYIAALASSGWYTLIYAVSNVIFLLVLTKPIGSKIERVKTKYGI